MKRASVLAFPLGRRRSLVRRLAAQLSGGLGERRWLEVVLVTIAEIFSLRATTMGL